MLYLDTSTSQGHQRKMYYFPRETGNEPLFKVVDAKYSIHLCIHTVQKSISIKGQNRSPTF